MTKSKGLFGKLMDLVTEEVPQKGTQQTVEPTIASKPTSIPTQSLNFDESVPEKFRTKNISANQAVQGRFNEEFYNHFQAEIKKNDLEGADYYEFRKTYEVLSKSMPEIAALNATYQALRATSPELDVPKLLETAKFYLGLIDKEDESFEAQFNEKLNTEVIGRETAIEEEHSLQDAKLKQIEALKLEIAESQDRISGLEDEKNAEEYKLKEVKANWDFTIKLVKNNINTDVSNIQSHLVDTTNA